MENYILKEIKTMSKNIKKMLKDEIISDFEAISSMDIGSKERSTAIDDLTKLYRLSIEESKIEREADLKKDENFNFVSNQKNELIIKEKQFELDKEMKLNNYENSKNELHEQRIDRIVKISIAAAELILPLMFYALWMKRGLEFEKFGTYTSATFQGLFRNFKPTKK